MERDLREYSEDLYLVSFPFGIDLGANPIGSGLGGRNYGEAGMMGNSQPLTPGRDLTISDRYSLGSEQNPASSSIMSLLFWLTIVFGLLEVVVMFEKYDFLNLLVFVCSLSIFLLNYFDKNYLVLCIALTGVSVLMDTIWLFVLGPKHWNPPAVGEFSVGEWGYLRIIFFFTILQIVAKVGIILLLLRQRSLPEGSGFVIDMPKLTIFGNRRNPISQQVGLVTGGRF